MKAKIFDYRDPQNPWVLAVVETGDNGRVHITTHSDRLKRAIKNGIQLEEGKTLTPEDGDDFVSALPTKFDGSYIRAKIVE